MPKKEHVSVLKQGSESWNQWRTANPKIQPDLTRAELVEADLEGADLRGSTFHGANLRRANLCNANLELVVLQAANLQHANLKGAILRGANLQGAQLEHGVLDDADLGGANLQNARFQHASLRRANLDLATAGPIWLNDSILEEASLKGVSGHIVLTNATCVRARFGLANLSGSTFADADLQHADFEDARLDGSNLEGAILANANLDSVDFNRADLRRANLQYTNLHDADLSNANLLAATLDGANLKGANLEGANLLGASHVVLDGNCIRGARFSPNASDPWSRLRRSYTGPKFLFNVLLLIVFFIPYAAKTLMWVGVNHAQEAVRSTTDRLEQIAAELVEEGHPASVLVRESASELARLGPCLRGDCEQFPIWQVLVGADRSPSYWLLATALLLYNAGRLLLTWRVGPLREEEERSGYAPVLHGFSGYQWLYRVHLVMLALLSLA